MIGTDQSSKKNIDVMRICISLRLGSKICHSFECDCGKAVDESEQHDLHCKKKERGEIFELNEYAELNSNFASKFGINPHVIFA